jgi:maleate cis-trans isomerase
VVTSNQAVIWETLSLLGVNDRRNCRGLLFDSLAAGKSAAARVPA